MRLKRYITILMLAVYLFAVGAPAYGALSCRCVAMKAQTEHRCCSHCNHDNSVTQGLVHFEAPCCGDHHSTEIELYTASHDGERLAKRLAAMDLPPALVAEQVVSIGFISVFSGYVVEQKALSVPDSHVSSCGLRAPPVLV